MKAPWQIETAQLILRQPTMSDAATMFERYANDPEVTRFLGWRSRWIPSRTLNASTAC
jgi:RimJ/RimL family protein N-acetyltransferase